MHNIAFFITVSGWGGLEMNVLKMAIGLSEQGYNVSLFTSKNSRISEEAIGKVANIVPINTPRKYVGISDAKKIAQLLKERNIDTLIVNDNRDLDVIFWTKKLFYKNLKVIFHQQMQLGINKKDFIHTQRFNAIDYWISPLNWLKEQIEKNTKYPLHRVKVIPLCVDVKRFMNRKYSKEEALNKLNISSKRKLIGIIGRIDPKKGQGFVIKAFKELIKERDDIDLLIFGSATINDELCKVYENKINEYVISNKLSDRVYFRKFSPDTEMFYNSVDIFTIATESETFGMVTIEAMLSGIPILAANTGGSPEILNEGKLGRLYDFENIEHYCEQVKWVLNHPADATKMAADAKEKARIEYSHINEIKRISEIIERLKK